MKALIITTKGEFGGAQIFAKNLAFGLKKRRHAVIVAAGNGNGDFLERELSREKINFKRFYNLSRSFSPLRNFFFVLEVRKYLSDYQFDVLQLNGSNTLLAALAARLVKNRPKIIFTHHGLSFLDPHSKNHLGKFFLRLAFKSLLPFVDQNVFVSKNNLVKEGTVVENGIEKINLLTKKKAQKILESKIGISLKNKFIIGSVGRLAYPKNYEFLIKSAGKITATNPEAMFIVIGDGPEKEKYQKMILEKGLEKKFFLAGEMESASRFIGAFDIFTLMSLYEGLPMTLLEALQAGLPVLISENSNGGKIVKEEQIFTLDNGGSFSRKISELMRSRELRVKLGLDNKKISKRFSLNKMADQYLKLFSYET